MRIIVNRSELLHALALAASVVKTRTPKPVLACVKLEAVTDSYSVLASDLESSIRTTGRLVQVERVGEACVPAEQLQGIVNESVDDTIAIDVDGDKATILTGDSTFTVPTFPPADFPPSPMGDEPAAFAIPTAEIRRMLRAGTFAISDALSGYAGGGMCITAKGNAIEFASADPHAVGVAYASAKGPKEKASAIIPQKATKVLAKLADGDDEEVVFTLTDNHAVIRVGGTAYMTALLEGRFAPYADIIPKDCGHKVTADRELFAAAVRRSILMTDETSKAARFSFTAKGMAISSRAPTRGQAAVNLPCKVEGKDIDIGLNAKWMLEAVQAFDAEEITIELLSPSRPIVIRGGRDSLCVLAPCNLN